MMMQTSEIPEYNVHTQALWLRPFPLTLAKIEFLYLNKIRKNVKVMLPNPGAFLDTYVSIRCSKF